MGRRAEPKKDIEYIFRFKHGNNVKKTTLIFEGINEKGRLEFFNKEAGTYTSMPPERFSYIHRFNLVSEQVVVKKLSKQPVLDKYERQRLDDIEKEKKEREEAQKFNEQNLKCLKSFTEQEKTQLRKFLGFSVDELIEMYKNNSTWGLKEAQIMLNVNKLFPNKPWAV